MLETQATAIAAGVAALLAVILFASAIPGVFILDECNYLVSVVGVRQGELTIPGTAGLPASNELLYFEPLQRFLKVDSTPVSWRVPPLYAFIAQPFASLGFRGMILLSCLSFSALGLMVWLHVKGLALKPESPWVAMLVLTFGAYFWEYAQGAWPHTLAALLVFSSFHLASRVRRDSALAGAAAAGAIAGVAAGIRYQNVFVGICIGIGLLLAPRYRLKKLGTYTAAMAAVLAITASLNHARLGSWNPVSKAPGYLHVSPEQVSPGEKISNAVRTFWGRTVDFRAYPALEGEQVVDNPLNRRDPNTGTVSIGKALKKSWIQSAPWVGLMVLQLAWTLLPQRLRASIGARLRTNGAGAGPDSEREDDLVTELRAAAIAVLPVLAMFAWGGSTRYDGLCFNQRYLLELVPIVAVSFALILGHFRVDWLQLVIASGLGVGIAWACDSLFEARLRLLSGLPLALSVLMILAWLDARLARRPRLLWVAAGLCLGWALGVHVFDDLPASRGFRRSNLQNQRFVESRLPDKAAVFAWWGTKDALGPLQFDRDLVILDARADDGATAPQLAEALLRAGRPVFVLTPGFPPGPLNELLRGRKIVSPDPMEGRVLPPLVRIVDANIVREGVSP